MADQQARLESYLEYIRQLVARGGPQISDYLNLNAWIEKLYRAIDSNELPNDAVEQVRQAFGGVFANGTMFGHAFRKPHGYPGDFEIIDRHYLSYTDPDPQLATWDLYWHAHPAAKAVRNRKSYFHDLLWKRSKHANGKRFCVLNLASGPGRDVGEFLSKDCPSIHFDCIDSDPDAIQHASELCADSADHVTFMRTDVLRFRPRRQYNLIWAAGLFDYFSDRVFKLVLRRLLPGVVQDGELVIGNFSTANPNLHWLRLCEWHLHYRSAEHLSQLAIQAGVPPEHITIGKEPEEVNLFLHISAAS